MQDNKDFKPKMLFAICFAEKIEWMVEKLKAANAHSITVNYATGIKKLNLAEIFGFNDNKRMVLTAVIDEKDVPPLFETLKHELYFEPNTGIAFTINIDAHAGAKSMILIDAFFKNYLDVIEDDDDEEEKETIEDGEEENEQ